jgi:hypothetical protein
MRGLAVALALVGLLATPAAALAKGATSVSICGSQGCKALGDARMLGGFPDGGPTGEMPSPAPYYELRFTSRGGGTSHTWTTWYVPSSKWLGSFDDRGGVYWTTMHEPKLARAAAGVRPFPAPEITAVTIGSRRLTDDPTSYLRLLTVQSTNGNVDRRKGVPDDWEQITFVSKQRSPWTLAQSSIHFSPSTGLLQRGVEVVKLPDEVASDLRGGRPLVSEAPGLPWRKVVFAALGVFALVAAGTARPLRRRLSPKTA